MPCYTISQLVWDLGSALASFSFGNFDLSINLLWPSGLNLPQQLPLIFSAGVLGHKYLLMAFKFCYRKWKIEKWGAKELDKEGGWNRRIEVRGGRGDICSSS